MCGFCGLANLLRTHKTEPKLDHELMNLRHVRTVASTGLPGVYKGVFAEHVQWTLLQMLSQKGPYPDASSGRSLLRMRVILL